MGVSTISHCGVEVSPGNGKVTNSVIFNMCTGMFCPAAKLGFCKIGKKCYALKFENWRPNVLRFRMRQSWQWQNSPVSDYISCLRHALKKTGFNSIRFNESGDFTDVSCVEKLCDIAEAFPDKTVFGYTSRQDLKKRGCFRNLPSNIVLTGSGFMIHNEFGPYYKDTVGKVDCVGNCGNCKLCKVRGGKVIYNPMH